MAHSYGDFGDTGLEKATPVVRDSGHDLEKFNQALSMLEENARSMARGELFALQQKVGMALSRFNYNLLRAIERAK